MLVFRQNFSFQWWKLYWMNENSLRRNRMKKMCSLEKSKLLQRNDWVEHRMSDKTKVTNVMTQICVMSKVFVFICGKWVCVSVAQVCVINYYVRNVSWLYVANGKKSYFIVITFVVFILIFRLKNFSFHPLKIRCSWCRACINSRESEQEKRMEKEEWEEEEST